MFSSLAAWIPLRQRRILNQAGPIARAARRHITQLTEARLVRMAYYEARGYLRVHATPVVDSELAADAQAAAWPARQWEEVRDRAVAMLIDRVLADRAMSPQGRARRAA